MSRSSGKTIDELRALVRERARKRLALLLAGERSPVPFVEAHLSAEITLDDWQKEAGEAVTQSHGVLMLCGRQTGKSTLAASLANWKSTQFENSLTLLISPTLRQSSELFRKTMTLFDTMANTPGIKRRTQTELHLENESQIYSLPGANPDAIRGFSNVDLIIEDESAFVLDQTFTASRPMMATNPNAVHVLASTPYGRRGHFHQQWTSGDPYWRRIMIKSADCPRIAPEFLESERRTLSDRAYRQEYECEFLESASAVFPADWVERLVDDDARHGELMPDAVLAGEALATVDPGAWADLG